MEADRYQQIKAVLEEVLELEPGRRFPFLEKRCADDSELRLAVETLLAAHDEAKSFLEYEGAPDGTFDGVEKSDETPGCVGPYKTMEKLGEGGMGVVYLAEQEYPIRRRVALKIIKLGMDTRAVIARFEAERQALALMNHPNVAKVLDAGATEQGRPYFVMEYVKGVPVTEHCDRQRLTTKERLRLFMQVCEGVQHAHQKGIIHRDIKPSNILVQVEGDERIPKIIDFGVAKATQQRLTERTVFTELGQLIGTPEYMSPEQAEMTAEDIDTRTDVYSLGVLLYELLVGALPFDPEELRQAGFDEIRRKIREVEPSKPSTRISSLGEASTGSARKRRTDPASLFRQLRGDLDWITMKALEKDRTRRYDSPAEMAADVSRHLRHRPVVAGPPSTFYRAGKFVRRHRIGVAVAAVVFLALLSFAVRERIQANRIAREVQTAKTVSKFLTDLFSVSDPGEARGNTITAREILDRGSERIERELQDQPRVQTRLMFTMGNVYRRLGLYDQALPLWQKALAKQRDLLGHEHLETLHSMGALANLYRHLGRYDEAELLGLETVEVSRRTLGNEHPDTLRAINALAALHATLGRYDEAEPLYLEALEARRRTLGNEDMDTLVSMNNLGLLYKKQGRFDEAEPLYLETLQIRRRTLGGDHPRTLLAMNNLAVLYKNEGRHDEAEPLYLEALEGYRRVLGDEHPDTWRAVNNLAVLYKNQGRYDEAEPLLLENLEGYRRAMGEEHPGTLRSMGNLALLYQQEGRLDEAESLLVENLRISRRVLGEEHPDTLSSMSNLGLLYHDDGRYDEAERLWRDTLEGRRRVLGHDHRDTLASICSLGRIAAVQGQREEALGLLREALDRGWSDARIFNDSDLDSLRGDPEFEAIVADVKKRIGEE